MKAVPLLPGTNPPPDFWMYTEAPVAGHGVGFILDDTTAEFNHFAPNFGEKYAPPHLPVSIRDWTGREISRVYSDQYGSYNFLVPSTFTINPPFPSGVMPSMMVACMNHPGPITSVDLGDRGDAIPDRPTIIDPFFNRSYTTVLLHAPVPGGQDHLPRHAGAAGRGLRVGRARTRSTASARTARPAIYSVNQRHDNGPWVPLAPERPTLTIVSHGHRAGGQPGVRSEPRRWSRPTRRTRPKRSRPPMPG